MAVEIDLGMYPITPFETAHALLSFVCWTDRPSTAAVALWQSPSPRATIFNRCPKSLHAHQHKKQYYAYDAAFAPPCAHVPQVFVSAFLQRNLVYAILVERLLVAVALVQPVHHRLHPLRHNTERGFPRSLAQVRHIFERDEQLYGWVHSKIVRRKRWKRRRHGAGKCGDDLLYIRFRRHIPPNETTVGWRRGFFNLVLQRTGH